MMNNPVMVKELRGRMRGMRAFVVLSAFLLFLSSLAVLIYLVASLSVTGGGGPPATSVGKIVFSALFLLELFLVSFLTPAFTAGSFSGERERRTFDLLFSTPLPARQIVWGKFVAAVAYMVILVVASVPLMSSAFFMGGVAPEEVAIGFWILLLTAIAFGSIGLFFSSFLSSTVASTVLSYMVVLALTVGLPILAVIILPFGGAFFGRLVDPSWIESPPVIYAGGIIMSTNPFLAAGVTEGLYSTGKSLFFFWEKVGSRDVFFVSPWIVFSVIYLLWSIGLNLAATRLVKRRQ